MKELLGAGLLHGDCLTVTGRTVAENLQDTPTISDLKSQVHSWESERWKGGRKRRRGVRKRGHSGATPTISDHKKGEEDSFVDQFCSSLGHSVSADQSSCSRWMSHDHTESGCG